MVKIGGSEVRIVMVIKLAGAFCAFLIGAGFATGQEILQYFTNYGLAKSLGVLAINCILGAWTCTAVMNIGNEKKDVRGLDCYTNLCGKYVGTALSWFIPIFMFLTFVQMMSGFGATFQQMFNANTWIGASILAIACAIICLAGLTKIIDCLGFVGPCIIVIAILVAIGVLCTHDLSLAEWNEFVETEKPMTAGGNWIGAGISYALWNICMCMPFLSVMGSRANNKVEVAAGVISGNVLFSIGAFMLVLAEASQIEAVQNFEIPALHMAQQLSPLLGVIYAIILALAIFTTAVPLLCSSASRIFPEGSGKYKILVIILIIAGVFGSYIPFRYLVNIIEPLVGYVGILGWIFIIWRDIKLIKARFFKTTDKLPSDNE